MRRARMLALLVLASLPLAAADDAQRADLRRETVAAYRAQDWPRFLALAKQAVALRPDDVRALHNLACAEARNGHASAAAAAALKVADLGVDTGLLEDEDLATVKGDAAFAPVRERLKALATPVGKADEAFRLKEKTLLTEGIAFDSRTKRFFLSSVHERKVVVRDAAGKESDFFPPARDGVLGVLALRADPDRRVLWATSATMPEMSGFTPELEGRSELLRFDLDSERLLARFALAEPGKHDINDLALDAEGNLFVSDALGGGLWRLAAEGSALEAFVPPGAFRNPQGLAFSPGGKTLYVAGYGEGLFAVDVASRRLAPVGEPRGAVLVGIDGLLADGTGLIAVQNGVRPHRVVRLVLAAEGKRVARVQTLLRNDPRFDEPTLGVIDGPDLYVVAASQWPALDPKRFDAAKLKEPLVLRIALR